MDGVDVKYRVNCWTKIWGGSEMKAYYFDDFDDADKFFKKSKKNRQYEVVELIATIYESDGDFWEKELRHYSRMFR